MPIVLKPPRTQSGTLRLPRKTTCSLSPTLLLRLMMMRLILLDKTGSYKTQQSAQPRPMAFLAVIIWLTGQNRCQFSLSMTVKLNGGENSLLILILAVIKNCLPSCQGSRTHSTSTVPTEEPFWRTEEGHRGRREKKRKQKRNKKENKKETKTKLRKSKNKRKHKTFFSNFFFPQFSWDFPFVPNP